MNRELKFRAWDGKSMAFEGFNIIGECTMFGILQQYSLKEGLHLEITQWTGLKDVHGKDVYEGDIVKLDETPEHLKGTEFHNTEDISHHKIYWNVERAMFWDLRIEDGDSLAGHLDGDISFVSDCQIIGNIYQNPELLK